VSHPQPNSARRRLSRSALVGLVATIVDLVCLHVMIDVLGLAPTVANVPSLLMGLGVQFVGNKYYAFEDKSSALLRQGALFGAIEVGALLLNAGVFHLCVTFTAVGPIVVRIFASALVYFGYSYPLWHLIFKPGADALCTPTDACHHPFSKESIR